MACSSIPRASPRSTAISCLRTFSTSPASSAARAAPRNEKRPVRSSPARASMADLADLGTVLRKVADGEKLTEQEAAESFGLIMSGAATEAEIGALLMGLRVRGETVEEIAGAARALRARAVKVRAPEGAID